MKVYESLHVFSQFDAFDPQGYFWGGEPSGVRGPGGRYSYLEVRNELHFHDLTPGDGPSLRVRDRLAGTIRTHCTEFATRWQATAHDPQISPALTTLAKTKSSDQAARKSLVDGVERVVRQRGWGDGW